MGALVECAEQVECLEKPIGLANCGVMSAAPQEHYVGMLPRGRRGSSAEEIMNLHLVAVAGQSAQEAIDLLMSYGVVGIPDLE